MQKPVYTLLKIEGRMKQVTVCSRHCFLIIENILTSFSRHRRRKKTFRLKSRTMQAYSGIRQSMRFYGCDTTSRQNGPDMVTFVKPSYEKTNDRALQQQDYREPMRPVLPKVPVTGELVSLIGWTGCSLPGKDTDGVMWETFRTEGMGVMQAQKKPSDWQADVAQPYGKRPGIPRLLWKSCPFESAFEDEDVFLTKRRAQPAAQGRIGHELQEKRC